jgi:Niemann-Pick C1 protein
MYITGTSYENEQELRTHPSTIINNDVDEKTGYFERLGAKTENYLERIFTAWGTFCADNPWQILLLGVYILHCKQ